MYYLMDWRVSNKENDLDFADLDVIPAYDIPWVMGIYWDEPVQQPIKLELDSDSGKDMPDAFFVGIPLFSEKLLAILLSNGADNIQTYEAEILDKRDNTIYSNYKATNIIGLVSAANLDKSRYIEGSGAPLMYFERLVLNKNLISDLQIFRLGESAKTLIINEKIAKSILEAKLTGIRILKLESA